MMSGIFDVACIGTSLTDSWSANNWPLEAQALLQPGKRERVRFYAVARQAKDSAWGLANIKGVTDKRPRAALIEFAINDCLHPLTGIPNLTLQQSFNNTAAIIDAIRAARPDTLIWLMTMNPCIPPQDQYRVNLPGYYAQYSAIAAAKGVGLIDNYSKWLTRSTAQIQADIPDGSHPRIEAQREVLIPNVVAALAPHIT